MAWTTPPTFGSGNVLSAAQLNILSDDMEYLKGFVAGSNPGCPAIALANSGNIYYLIRHLHRYLHIKVTNTGGDLEVLYDANSVYTHANLTGVETFDIDTNGQGLTVGAFYVVTVNLNGGTTHTCHYAIETTEATF